MCILIQGEEGSGRAVYRRRNVREVLLDVFNVLYLYQCPSKFKSTYNSLCCLVTQLCLTLYHPMDHSLPGSFVRGDSPGKNNGVGCHALLQGVFPTQGLNPSFPYCRLILYHWAGRKFLNSLGETVNM